MKKIDGTPKTIRELFTGVKYTIHYYQREYQWRRKQIEELIEDLTSEFFQHYSEEDELKDILQYGHYFMGSVVLTEDDNAIIDGQQRLTSLSLLLLYLYHRLQDDEDKAEVLNMIFSKKAGEKSYNINVKERNACLDAIKNKKDFDSEGHPESVQNIYRRYFDIKELMDDKLEDHQIIFFKDWLIENVEFIRIQTQTEQDAHKIFVSMNDRGLSLTPTEMLKGFLLSEISDDDQRREANDIWKSKILELKELGKEEESDFIKNWLRAQYADSIRERKKGAAAQDFEIIGTTFHKWTRENATKIGLVKPSDYYHFVRYEFVKYCDIYFRINQYARSFTTGFGYIFYNANKNFTLQSQLLLAAIDPADSSDVVDTKLRVVSCFLDNYLIRRIFNYKTVDYSAMMYNIFLLTKKIRRKPIPELVDMLTAEVEAMEFKLSGIKHFRLNGWTKRYMLHVLARLTHFIERETGLETRFETYVDRQIKNSYDIEHIWADKYERHLDTFDTEEAFDEFRDRFGDLILLPRDKNRSYSDYTYKQKLPHYYGENLLARSLNPQCYQNNPQFKNFREKYELDFEPYEEYTTESIEKRQELYEQIAHRIWDVSRIKELAGDHLKKA
ncbi:DUF262 domain-containing protein [Marivirga harenae]|uniref:DUF262 domain-containing protein n=1 Tax=Marivirga harenae TaxID=2010992 RepID=UPI0026DED21E|nr:DUF262 domain-containing protein [Marivirga harenae]WKV12191.1 DUF262 domain-containing protein [Marivirga harenae]